MILHSGELWRYNLVYAMYCSKRTPTKYKPYLEKVLEEAYDSE